MKIRHELHTECNVALLISGDVPHAFAKAGHHTHLVEIVLDEMLSRLREGRLDDEHVHHHGLGQLRC